MFLLNNAFKKYSSRKNILQVMSKKLYCGHSSTKTPHVHEFTASGNERMNRNSNIVLSEINVCLGFGGSLLSPPRTCAKLVAWKRMVNDQSLLTGRLFPVDWICTWFLEEKAGSHCLRLSL